MLFGLPFCASNINSIKESVPNFTHNYLVKPFEVDNAVRIIENYYTKPNALPFMQAKSWASSKYDSDIQFGKFYNKL
jgi:response regulator of citrate/malate metabolism